MSRDSTPQKPHHAPGSADGEHWWTSSVWRNILDSVPSGLVAVDTGGNIVHCNPYAEMALGLHSTMALGRHFRDVFCPSLPLPHCWVSHALKTGESRRSHRFFLEHSTGRRYALEGDLTPVRDERGQVLGAMVAVREAEDVADDIEERLQRAEGAILDSIADGLYTVDHEWRITSFNRAAERLTGLREEDVLGQVCRSVLRTDRCEEGCPLATTLEQNENVFGCEVTLRCDSPNRRGVSVNTAVLYDRDHTPIGGLVTFRDTELDRRVKLDLEPTTQFEGMVGSHPNMREVYDLVAEVADSDASVLIMGESGTGKEMIADAVVRRSRRRDRPCVKVNCSVYPDTLLESELFGHVKGAFTDARQDRAGRFLLADGGTVFLDEIGEISAAAQVKLLRVLQDRAFEPLGSSTTARVDVRIVAATNRDLPQLVREGHFRDDLYYRLNVIPVVLPPLRARRSDIPLLVDYFLAKYRLLTGKPIERISANAMDLLIAYDYPGNVRELENAVEHAFARTRAATIELEKLPLALREQEAVPVRSDGGEKDVLQALEQARWNRDRAAQLLGVSRTTLWRRMKALGLSDSGDSDS